MLYSKRYPIDFKEPYNEKTLFIKQKNYTCEVCGQKAEFIYKRHGSNGFNYGYVSKDGLDYLTLDHLIPRCIGGTNAIKNMQVMCQKCNGLKGSSIVEKDIVSYFNKNGNCGRYIKTDHFYLLQDTYYLYQIHRCSFVCEVLYCSDIIEQFYPVREYSGRVIKLSDSFLRNKKNILG